MTFELAITIKLVPTPLPYPHPPPRTPVCSSLLLNTGPFTCTLTVLSFSAVSKNKHATVCREREREMLATDFRTASPLVLGMESRWGQACQSIELVLSLKGENDYGETLDTGPFCTLRPPSSTCTLHMQHSTHT